MALLLEQGGYLLLAGGGKILLQGDPGAVPHVLAPPWRTASAGTTNTTAAWPQPLDPSELKYYTVDWSGELDATGDRILSSLVTPSDLATLAGLRIRSETNDNTRVTIWFEIDAADRNKADWNAGQVHHVTSTITTMGGQVLERTVSLRVQHLGQPA